MGPLLAELNRALSQGQFELVRDRARAEIDRTGSHPRLEQFLGLAHRGLLDSNDAHAAFTRAMAAAPQDPLIAHSLARTALEAGFASSELFARAASLAPNDAGVLLGRAAALHAEGRGETALAELEALLTANPEWTEGHQTHAQLQATLRPDAPRAASIDKALQRLPRSVVLHRLKITVHMGAYDYAAALEAVAAARRSNPDSPDLVRFEAMCRCELSEADRAFALFATLPIPDDAESAVWPIRALIKLGRFEDALRFAERDFPLSGMGTIWPYRALLWRLQGDPRRDWLEGDPRLVQSYDLTSAVGSLSDLAQCLRGIHRGSGQPLNQSVRGGTQTDGQLFARAEPEIRQLRAAIADAVATHIAQLPPPDPAHPSLPLLRAPVRFAGSWSVRLTDAGYHHDHVHSHGWLSSAFYVAVPDLADDLPEAGSLAFGENLRLLPDVPAFKVVPPKAGSLTIFPSTMWHGTRPFGKGERLTVAFDIARPTLSA